MRILFKSCLSVLVSCVAVTTPAMSAELKHPDWHPDGDLLVAEGSCRGSIDLYLIALESHSVQLVRQDDLVQGYPRWFPDGKRIVYHEIDDLRNARIVIATLSQNGQLSEATIISDGPFDIEPAPSPDGAQIAYSMQGENGQDIAVLDLQGNAASKVWKTQKRENFPSWHPDGRSIIFHASDNTDTQIYSRDLQTNQITALTTLDGPNLVGHIGGKGKRLVYGSEREGDREIYLRDISLEKDTRLTNHPGRDGYPKFSPDGLTVAYHSAASESDTSIRVSDTQGKIIDEFSCKDLTQAN